MNLNKFGLVKLNAAESINHDLSFRRLVLCRRLNIQILKTKIYSKDKYFILQNGTKVSKEMGMIT